MDYTLLYITIILILTVLILILLKKYRRLQKDIADTASEKDFRTHLMLNSSPNSMVEYTQLLFDASPLSCALWDKNFTIINCNHEALRLFGVKDREEFNGKFYDLSPEQQPGGKNSKDMIFEMLNKTFSEGYFQTEWIHKLSDGELIPCEITLVRLKYEQDYLVAGYTRDLRDHKAYIAEIEEAQGKLLLARDSAEAANVAKSAFLANMSHEIRTPMNSIIGFTELAKDDNISVKTQGYLNKILENAEWLLLIINDILDLSKVESGKMDLENIPFDLHSMFANCRASILPKAMEKGLAMFCYIEESLTVKILGDPVRLRQALLNLLSNAVKFTETGTVRLFATIANSTDKHLTIHFEVKDSGIGIDPEKLAQIFKPFSQADGSITRKYGGTGLGLTITSNIIEMMGGKINVSSILGVGSEFSFTLTFEIAGESVLNVHGDINMELKDLEKPRFEGEILICEDNIMNQQVICGHLARVGLKAVVAENGEKGVEIVANRMDSGGKPFDLIFMDIHMPIMDGVETAAKILWMGCKTPIVAMTANVMADDVKLYKESGMVDFIGKPFTSQELWRCLMRYLPVIGVTTMNKSALSAENEKIMRHLKVNFLKSNKNTFGEITKALNEGNIHLAHRLAHSLKSNAGQIGEKHLEAAAAVVEEMLAGGKNLLTEEQSNFLDTELRLVLEDLSKEEYQSEAEPMSESDTTDLINELEEMLINDNPECMNLIGSIRMLEGTEELIQYIEDFEFDKAQEALINFKKQEVMQV